MQGTFPSRANHPRVCAATGCQDGKCDLSSTFAQKGKSMAIVVIGIDLAKNVFAGRGVDKAVTVKRPRAAPSA